MYIRLGHEIVFNLPAPTPMILALYTHPSLSESLRQPDTLRVEPYLPVDEFIDAFGNRCGRIDAPAGRLLLGSDTIVEMGDQPDVVNLDARQLMVGELPTDTLQFLLGSRYCEVSRLSPIAWELFGKTPLGWPRVQAVCDWVHSNIQFGYQFASPDKTAYDVYEQRTGVCRDFMHLAITFCRCLNIPARYATGYLGDIRIPLDPAPMDFSAWFEVFLGGEWYTFDARFNTPRIGRVLMARGRDAVDVALTTSFGPTTLEKFKVWSDEVSEPYFTTPRPTATGLESYGTPA